MCTRNIRELFTNKQLIQLCRFVWEVYFGPNYKLIWWLNCEATHTHNVLNQCFIFQRLRRFTSASTEAIAIEDHANLFAHDARRCTQSDLHTEFAQRQQHWRTVSPKALHNYPRAISTPKDFVRSLLATRKLITFGIQHKLIRCINKYPICISDSPSNRQRCYTGVHNIDEICCKIGLTPDKIQEDIDREPSIVIISKWTET